MTTQPRPQRAICVRMAPDLHKRITELARAKKVSLNVLCVAVFEKATRTKRNRETF